MQRFIQSLDFSGLLRRIGLKVNSFVVTALALSCVFSVANGQSLTESDLDTSFNPILTNDSGASVYGGNIVLQTDGKILIAGGFTKVNNVPRSGLARLNADGTLDASFNPGNITDSSSFPAGVGALALQTNGKIIVGGRFTSINGVLRKNTARLNTDGTVDETFNPGSGAGDAVSVVTIQPDGKILVGGGFFTFNGATHHGIARLNADGSLDSTFTSSGINGDLVTDIKLQSSGKILVSGYFDMINGTARNALACLNLDGSLDNSFDANLDFNVTAIALQSDGKILIVGGFGRVGNVARPGVARLNPDSSLDASFNPTVGITGTGIYAVEPQSDGKVLTGFETGDSSQRDSLARANPDGSLDASFNAHLSGFQFFPVIGRIVSQPDGKILIAGDFRLVNGTPRPGFARLLGTAANQSSRKRFDFDGDGRADISVFRPSNGVWYLQNSTNGFSAVQFGASNDLIAPADYDADGKTDVAVFRPSTGVWYILRSSDNTVLSLQFGASGDLPRPADFDGDGKADFAVFRPSNGVWYRLNSANGGFVATQFGTNGDAPLVGDFDGDGKADLTVFRPSNGTWYRLNSGNGQFNALQFGISEDVPVAGDYDADGKADVAVFRPSTGVWYILNSSDNSILTTQFGASGDVPTAADYDGDGRTDISVFRPSSGIWYRLNSANNSFFATQFGVNGDKPAPAAFAP